MPLVTQKNAALFDSPIMWGANLTGKPNPKLRSDNTFLIHPNSSGSLDDRTLLVVGGTELSPIAAACGAYIPDWIRDADNASSGLVDLGTFGAAVKRADAFLCGLPESGSKSNDVDLMERFLGLVLLSRNVELPMFILSSTARTVAAARFNDMGRELCDVTPNALFIDTSGMGTDPMQIAERINTELLWIEDFQSVV